MMITCADLFAGAGGFSTGARMAGLTPVYAANHWPAAVEIHARNHPGAQHACQDLHQADWSTVPAHDVLLASPCCIPGNAQVVCADGSFVRADALQLGDMVMTHEGRGRKIVNVWTKLYSGTICGFSMWGDTKQEVTTTADHKVWIRRRGGNARKLGDPVFARAEEVRAGDYVAFPRGRQHEGSAARFVERLTPGRVEYSAPESVVPTFKKECGMVVKGHIRKARTSSLPGAKVLINGDSLALWWLVGHYLGDGQSREERAGLGWSTGGSTENFARVQAILEELGLSSWSNGEPTNRAIYAQSKHLYALCAAFGSHAYNKLIPVEVEGFEARFIESLIDGYLAADGSERKGRANKTLRATSVSLDLLQGIQRLCWRLGWSASISKGDSARTCVIEGRTVNCRDSWELSIIKTPHAQSRTKFTESHVWRSVREVKRTQASALKVWDFEVEEDHTFCLPGMVVHNCQGHSKARGKASGNPQHDASRSTAWAVVSAAEYHRPPVVVVENVPEFAAWSLYPAWRMAMEALGYTLAPHIVDAADHGVAQHRTRLFIVCTRSTRPLMLDLPRLSHVGSASLIDFDAGKWSRVDKPGRALATLARIRAGRAAHGERFVTAYYGSERGGRALSRPLGTITTVDRWGVINGDRMRMLSAQECRAAMGFPAHYQLPTQHKAAVHMLGNAVVPIVARDILNAIRSQA